MFSNHNPKINHFAQRSPDNLFLVVMMVSLSIQQKWVLVGDMMVDMKQNKLDSKFIWGNKKNTYKYISTHKHFIYGQMMAVINSNKSDTSKSHSLMKIFLQIDGLGLAKAGFVCQLVAGLVGCIDVHNIKQYNIKPDLLVYNKTVKTKRGQEANEKRLQEYVALCEIYTSERLWNAWCALIADKYPKDFLDDYHVSELHYTYLVN